MFKHENGAVKPARFPALNLAAIGTFLITGGTAFWMAFSSLKWRIQHDLPLVLYFGWLIDHLGFVPYRDIFDPNMPGTYLLSIVIGRVSNYQDIGIRWFDLAWLAGISAFTIGWVRKLGWRQAALGPALFALIYLANGPAESLQREYCLLLPLTAAIFFVFGLGARGDAAKAIAAGLLFGIGFTIKPHILIFMPWLMFFHILDIRARSHEHAWITQRNLSTLTAWLGGAFGPIAAAFIFVWHMGALREFWDMASHYWRLYGHLTGQHESITPGARAIYVITNSITANPMTLWIPISLVGVASSLRFGCLDASQRRMVMMLAVLALIAVLYVALAGKFFEYHWLLHSFFLCQLTALNLTPIKHDARKLIRVLPPAAVLFTVIFVADPALLVSTRFNKSLTRPPKNGRVDAIANYLKSNMHPGDTVQPLDWTDGATHAMLEARAPVASRFNGDYMFCHDVSNRYIQKLRREFTETMDRVHPRFIIYVNTVRPHGLDCDDNTTGLIPRFRKDYRVAFSGDHFDIYERNDATSVTRLSTKIGE